MRTIEVFPDYCSSGLWENGANMYESEFEGVLNQSDLMALKYWHSTWEWFAEDEDYPSIKKLSTFYWDQWSKDGQALVESWNAKQDVFKFVYSGDYWK